MPPPKVFISYSHKDEAWLNRLVEHLAVSAEEADLDLWDDRRIAMGDEWHLEIGRSIDEAHAAILLVSPSFLVSKFIRRVEVPQLLERRSKDGLRIFPVLTRSCNWQGIPWLSALQVRPYGARPLASLKGDDRDSAMAVIAQEVRSILAQPSSPPQPTPPPGLAEKTALAALHQLPTPPADFTGREAELAELRQAVAQGGVTISGVRGMGGVGKTTLALKLAEQLKPFFPDAQIYLDLKGVSPEPLSPAQAMAHVIRSFHPDAPLPESEAGLPALYRSVLDGKRALLLMDNAAGREQVEPLVPPKSCVLLVTSRERFSLRGFVFKDLDTLPLPEACDLLLRIEPRIGENASEIARLCGGLPLALSLAGSALAERADLAPAAYLKRLAAKERLGFAEAALSLSYELLSENLRKHWRALAVFPGTFDAIAAAAVWGLETDPAEEMIGPLLKSSLVEWKEGRYRLHDLARVFAENRLDETQRTEAQRRHAEHYADVLAAADDLYMAGGEYVPVGLRLFDLEWGNIQVGFAWASEEAEADEAAARLCNRYPTDGAYILALRQQKREWIQWSESALAAAQRLKDRSAEGMHLGNLGLAYADLGEAHRAIEHYEQHLQIAREVGDRHGEGRALGNLGNAYADLGEVHCAIEYYEQRLQIAREIGDRRGEGTVLGNLGIAYKNLGEVRRAIEHYEQALQIAREIGARLSEGFTLGNLGVAYVTLGEARRAIDFFEQDLQIAREVGDRRGEGQTFNNIGFAYAALGETRRATDFYKQSLHIAREVGNRMGEAEASWNLGLRYEAQGDLKRAVELMQVRVDYERDLGHPDTEKDAGRVEAIRAHLAAEKEPSS